MAEYINATTLLKEIDYAFHTDTIGKKDVINLIINLPVADITPVLHGRWIMGTGENGLQTGHRKCSQCGEIVKYGYSLYGVHNFCNYCGAKMNDEVNT